MKKYAIAIVVMSVLFSCKIGKNYKGTDFAQPSAFSQADTTASIIADSVNTDSLELTTADLRWWNMYDDPVLDSLIIVAMENNRDVLIAAESVLQARYFLKIQNAEFLPKFDINGQFQRGNFLLQSVGDPSNLVLPAAQASWELDLWGETPTTI